MWERKEGRRWKYKYTQEQGEERKEKRKQTNMNNIFKMEDNENRKQGTK